MATITPTRQDGEGGTYRHTWANIAPGDTCAAISFPGAPDATVQVFGTFGGATITLEGSLEAAATTYFALQDVAGNNISFTAAGGEVISTSVVTHIRPAITAGTASVLTVIVLQRGA